MSTAAPGTLRGRVWRGVDRGRAAAAQALSAGAAVPRPCLVIALCYAAVNWLGDLACLILTACALQLPADPVAVAGVYLATQLVRQVPLTPGGVGLIETTLLTGFVATGVGEVTAGAVVIAYRLLSCWLVLLIGAVAWAALRWSRPTIAAPRVRPVGQG